MRAIAWLSQDLKVGEEISINQAVKIWGNQCERWRADSPPLFFSLRVNKSEPESAQRCPASSTLC